MMQLLHAKRAFGWLFAFAMAILLSGCFNKPQTRAEELDKYCANKTGNIITTHVEFRGQRLSCEQYLALREQGWPQTATERPGKTFSVEEIIRLKNAGVSDEVILQLLQSRQGNLPRQ